MDSGLFTLMEGTTGRFGVRRHPDQVSKREEKTTNPRILADRCALIRAIRRFLYLMISGRQLAQNYMHLHERSSSIPPEIVGDRDRGGEALYHQVGGDHEGEDGGQLDRIGHPGPDDG